MRFGQLQQSSSREALTGSGKVCTPKDEKVGQ